MVTEYPLTNKPDWNKFIRFIKRAGAIAVVGSVITGGTVGGLFIRQQFSTPGINSAGANTANFWIDSNGGTCTRSSTPTTYNDAAACADPLTACNSAQSGDVIILKPGTYTANLSTCHGHASFSTNILFKPETGHQCPTPYPNIPNPFTDTSCDVNFTTFSMNGGNTRNCDLASGAGHPLPSTLSAAQRANWVNHIDVQGIYLGPFDMRCVAFVNLINDNGKDWYMGQGSYHVFILGGDFGNRTDGGQPTMGDATVSIDGSDPGGTSFPPAENIQIIKAVIHDFTTNDPSSHGDGTFVDPSYDVHLIQNVLARNDCIPMYSNFAQWPSIGIHGYWIIGNVVHTDTTHITGGSRCGQSISLGDNTQIDTIVAFNSIEGPIRRSPDLASSNTNIRLVGNITPVINAVVGGNSDGCATGVTASYNVLTQSGVSNCGDTTNSVAGVVQYTSIDAQPNSPTNSDPLFTSTLGNYQLLSGVAAIGIVPVSWCNSNPGVCPTTDINGNTRPNPAHPSFYDAGAYENR